MNDEFDQCDARNPRGGGRCHLQAGHDGPHGWEGQESASVETVSAEKIAAEAITAEKIVAEADLYPKEPEIDAIHGYFELTYANYLVMNRSLLQSMTDEWQDKFVKLLREFDQEFYWAKELQPAINVQILARSPEILPEEVACESCDGSGENRDGDEDDEDDVCIECDGDGTVEREGNEYESPEEIGKITDPVPHYERGRTSVPRASQSIDEVSGGHYRLYWEWFKANYPTEHKRETITAGSEVEVVHHPSHVLPPIIQDIHGTFDGVVQEVLKDDLYKVKIHPFGLDDDLVIQVHIDQLHVD